MDHANGQYMPTSCYTFIVTCLSGPALTVYIPALLASHAATVVTRLNKILEDHSRNASGLRPNNKMVMKKTIRSIVNNVFGGLNWDQIRGHPAWPIVHDWAETQFDICSFIGMFRMRVRFQVALAHA
jgi:hypothetical protein